MYTTLRERSAAAAVVARERGETIEHGRECVRGMTGEEILATIKRGGGIDPASALYEEMTGEPIPTRGGRPAAVARETRSGAGARSGGRPADGRGADQGERITGTPSGETMAEQARSAGETKTDTGTPGEVETVAGEVIPATLPAGALPSDTIERIEGLLADFSARYDIEDLRKASGQQWRSACIYIGHWVQSRGLLRDAERERTEGGKIYSAERVEALLEVWEYVTGLYKHIPLHTDFIAFSGVSREWFYDYEGRGLTSAGAQIVKKTKAIEEAGLSAGLVDSRENPTGRIYYTKARLGWRESVEIVHTDGGRVAPASSLPVFDDGAGRLIGSNTDV